MLLKKLLIRFRRRVLPRLALLLAATVIGLIIADCVVRIGHYDRNLLAKMVCYQNADRGSFVAVDDPYLLFRTKPGSVRYRKDYTVNINELGFRGPPVSPLKTPGVFRILVVGGSNVYGLGVGDEQAWPRQLEAVLQKDYPGTVEVLNGGACAYVPVQMAIVAEQALDKCSPDLIIYAVSNGGARCFMHESDPMPYFLREPRMWDQLFTPLPLRKQVFQITDESRFLLGLSAMVRLYAMAITVPTGQNWVAGPMHEPINVAKTRELAKKARGKARMCVFLFPGTLSHLNDYSAYYTLGADVPVMELSADGMPQEYMDIHPPPKVHRWYAENIAKWLKEQNLLP